MTRPFALILFAIAFAAALGLVLADDGMAACQVHHSFGVCHDAIY